MNTEGYMIARVLTGEQGEVITRIGFIVYVTDLKWPCHFSFGYLSIYWSITRGKGISVVSHYIVTF